MFNEEDKRIYSFAITDGQDIYLDPIYVLRQLTHYLGGNPNDMLDQSKSPVDEVAYPAMERILATIRHVFSLPPINPASGNGITDAMCIKVLNNFLDYLDTKKKITVK